MSESKVRAYLESVADADHHTPVNRRDGLEHHLDVKTADNVLDDARFVASVRDGGEPTLARELAAERAAAFSDDAVEGIQQLVDTVAGGAVATVGTREQRNQAQRIQDHPARRILELVAEGRPLPDAERLEQFGLSKETAAAVHRNGRILTALSKSGGRNPRLVARRLATEIADKHPLPDPDPWDGFTVDRTASGGDSNPDPETLAKEITGT